MTVYVIQSQLPSHPASWHGQALYLALATLELNPQLVLVGDALVHLQRGHDASHDERSLQKRYALLDLYECPPPLVISEDTAAPAADWIMAVERQTPQQLAERLACAGKVLRF